MNRREFIAGTATLFALPRHSWAQRAPRRVGYLDHPPKYAPLWEVWLDSVRDHGWIEGKNLIIDYRSAEGHAERLPPLAAELVARSDGWPEPAGRPGSEIRNSYHSGCFRGRV